MKSAKHPVAACFLHTFLLENKVQTSGKNTGLWFSKKLETTCKNSAHLDEKKQKQTKIRHRMDMLWRLQLQVHVLNKIENTILFFGIDL